MLNVDCSVDSLLNIFIELDVHLPVLLLSLPVEGLPVLPVLPCQLQVRQNGLYPTEQGELFSIDLRRNINVDNTRLTNLSLPIMKLLSTVYLKSNKPSYLLKRNVTSKNQKVKCFTRFSEPKK